MNVETDVTVVYDMMVASEAKTIVNVGGAGSSKSYSTAQVIVDKLVSEKNKVFGILRKTFPALRITAMKLILDQLKEVGIYDEKSHNKSNATYKHLTNEILFLSLDDPEKIKSAEFNYIWMEECTEFTYNDYLILRLRLRRAVTDGNRNQMFLSCNPVDAHSWVAALCGEGDTDLEKLEKEDG